MLPWQYNFHSVLESRLAESGPNLLLHQWRYSTLLLTTNRETTCVFLLDPLLKSELLSLKNLRDWLCQKTRRRGGNPQIPKTLLSSFRFWAGLVFGCSLCWFLCPSSCCSMSCSSAALSLPNTGGLIWVTACPKAAYWWCFLPSFGSIDIPALPIGLPILFSPWTMSQDFKEFFFLAWKRMLVCFLLATISLLLLNFIRSRSEFSGLHFMKHGRKFERNNLIKMLTIWKRNYLLGFIVTKQ